VTTRHHGRDRTPSRRPVAVLLGLGLLLVLGWLLASGRLDLPHPLPAHSSGPMTVTIPSIGVKAGIVRVGLAADGAMQVPAPDRVGWYDRGPWPGDPGPAVLVGHVDTRTGPAVFYRLRRLRPGDQILVGQRDGSTARFIVQRLERHPKSALPTGRIWTRTSKRLLRLITCSGIYDRASGHYRDNLIVYAARAGS
jgi:sortase (surface protein transpeptidase)